MFARLWTFMLVAFGSAATVAASGREHPECASIETFNTFVASQNSCSHYIFCDGEQSFEGECPDDNVFNEREGACDNPDAVVCALDVPAAPPGDPLASEPSRPTLKPPLFVATSVNPPTALVDGVSQCPASAGILHLPNTASCAAYYTCHNGLAMPMICAGNMLFNADSGRCERRENVNCPVQRPVQLQCNKGVYDFMPHARKCEYYYFCANGFRMIFECPFQFTWHFERRVCVHRTQSKCFSNTMLQEMLLA